MESVAQLDHTDHLENTGRLLPSMSAAGTNVHSMGFTSVWAISSHPDSFISELSPRVLPAMEADRSQPLAQQRWSLWQQAPLPDYRTWYRSPEFTAADGAAVESFRELMAPGPHVDDLSSGLVDPDFSVIDDVWADLPAEGMFVSVNSKDYAVASFFHAIGPARAALLPGWCGNFLLTSAQVRRTLPCVERALTFTQDERAAADAQDWLYYSPTDECVLDGPLRIWRAAADDGLGLCGLAVHVS
ncbi:hypothetical protein ACIRVF_24830 [Kitasatospora sp. NPDC101157]|uniref:hypothetical protein n=1 Tax=Kitasatospora sp. NPDC101157 TaxID=3364098 RepID=UPI003826CE29